MKVSNSIGLIAVLLMIIPMSLFSQALPGKTQFSILRSSTDSIQLRFELPEWKLESSVQNGETLHKISIGDAHYIFIDEEETLPVFSATLAIPYSGGANLAVLGSSNSNRNQIKLDFDDLLTRERNAGRYSADLYPAQKVLISEPKVIRDFRVVSVNVYPFQYDQSSKQLIINENMDIQIGFDRNPSVNEIEPPSRISGSFEKIYRGLILNYDDMISRETVYQSPVMLVIYGNNADATYQSKVTEYVNWKKQLGYLVTSVSTAMTGTTNTSIKAYIQNAYNTWTDKPEYVVLIGDTSGSMIIPTFGTYTDYQYTWLAGNDGLGDVVIGRISVENTEQMINYMAKVRLVEKNLNISTAQWLNRMLLVGDTAQSGISTIYTNEYIADVSSAVNSDYTYTKLYGSSPTVANMNTAINQGVSFFNFRGYIGMSGWTSVDYNTLNNAFRQFHAVIITCATGNFGGGTATTEAVVRAGSEATPRGAFTAIGMATSSTHTSLNNCLDVGIFHGIYTLGMRNMGEAMLLGKLYLDEVYGVSNPTDAVNFAAYCNLIGDPIGKVYVGIPETFDIVAPTSIPAGTHNVGITVRNSALQNLEGISVTLTNVAGTLHVAGFTDDSGFVLLDLPDGLSGSIVVTADTDDYLAASSGITINAAGGIVFEEFWADDGSGGSSVGNGDGIVNGGEVIELWVTIRNTSAAPISVYGRVATTDPYITLIEDLAEFGNVAAGALSVNSLPVAFSVSPACPDNHQAVFRFYGNSLDLLVMVILRNGNPEILGYTMIGAPGNLIYSGDQYPLTINLLNNGVTDLYNVSATLISYDGFFAIEDANGFYGNIAAGSTVSNTANTFNVRAQGQCITGMVIPLELQLSTPEGFSASRSLTLTIGNTSITDPLGQDAYGYFIFDEGDTGYLQAPTYSWIGIAPAEGGSGTALPLTDPGATYDEGDQVGAVSITTVNLPFPFTFYGRTYTQASISANGFIAFGSTTNSDWRNWRLPGPGGPNPMIAVFWDDLQLNAGSYVYTYYNSAQHYYVVEWYNVISGYDRVTPETFQAILYDPAYYPTLTGDGQIKLQYKQFNNIDLGSGAGRPHGNFATIGIKDHNGTVGLEYTFNNTYPPAAAPLSHESALFVTTRPVPMDSAYLTLGQTTIQDNGGDGQLDSGDSANVFLRLINHGTQAATNVSGTLVSDDPYVTVTQATAAYGSVAASGSADPIIPYGVQVSPSSPNGHLAAMTLNITSDQGNWVRYFSLPIYSPVLQFATMMVSDPSGNNNGIVDPGETVNIIIPLNNIGGGVSTSGTATMTSPTGGITINTGSVNFSAIPAGSYTNLTFNVTVSAAMPVGTLATVIFNAVAGSYSANRTDNIEVGAPLELIIGNGTSTQSYPIDRYYNYSVHESIYLASEIGGNATIKSIGFYKASGTDSNPIDAVSIYMKHTSSTTLASGNYSLAGYTLVYSGSFPNSSATGWMEANLNPMFTYSSAQNLQILIVKDYQQYINNYPQWRYSSASNRSRQNRSDSAMPTSLTVSNNLPNINIKYFPINDMLYPPQNLSASASHQSVRLEWSAPVTGTPTGYKIFRNGMQINTVTALTYTDTAVTNGTEYTYYLKAAYNGGDSDASGSVSATPAAIPPSDLIAVAGNMMVQLSWTGATGREELDEFRSSERAISGYKVYRNGSPIATITETTYQDTGLTNGVQYSYYVTTVYANPAGESVPSETVLATPQQVSFVTLGSGTSVTATNIIGLINLTYKSVHGQAVYTAAELNAAGVVGPVYITSLGFHVVSQPNLPLPGFIIRMKHTADANVSNWQSAAGMITVYSNASFMPTIGDYQMLALSTPFEWNGTDNIVIDTAFGLADAWSYSGTWQYTPIATNSYRRAYSDTVDQTNVFTGGTNGNFRPNVRLALAPVSVGPMIATDPVSLAFGEVELGSSDVQQFEIENTGDETLTGNITTPAGYTVTLSVRETSSLGSGSQKEKDKRNTMSFSIPAGQNRVYNLSFAPSAVAAYNGNVVISSNAVNASTVNIAVTGSGYVPPTISVDEETLSIALRPGENSSETFNITNNGSQALNYSITLTPANPDWISVSPLSGSLAGGQIHLITVLIEATELEPGTFEATINIASNDPENPTIGVGATLEVENNVPVLSLPASFEFGMNGSLVVDFGLYADDPDGDPLTLTCFGNTNVHIDMEGMVVTFTAVQDWIGTEMVTFSVTDGYASTPVTIPVNVMLEHLNEPVLMVSANAQGFLLQWNAVLHASSYQIFRAANPQGPFGYIGTTNGLSYQDNQTASKAFYYVKAVNNPPAK